MFTFSWGRIWISILQRFNSWLRSGQSDDGEQHGKLHFTLFVGTIQVISHPSQSSILHQMDLLLLHEAGWSISCVPRTLRITNIYNNTKKCLHYNFTMRAADKSVLKALVKMEC